MDQNNMNILSRMNAVGWAWASWFYLEITCSFVYFPSVNANCIGLCRVEPNEVLPYGWEGWIVWNEAGLRWWGALAGVRMLESNSRVTLRVTRRLYEIRALGFWNAEVQGLHLILRDSCFLYQFFQ